MTSLYSTALHEQNIFKLRGGTLLRDNNHCFYTGLQNPLHPFQPGESVNVQCTVLNLTCVGNHSVYWLIHTSQQSNPRIIKVHGMSNTRCEWSSDAGHRERKCVYSISKKALTVSLAGTHYCAVVACGEVLFGNRNRLHITGTFFPIVNVFLI